MNLIKDPSYYIQRELATHTPGPDAYLVKDEIVTPRVPGVVFGEPSEFARGEQPGSTNGFGDSRQKGAPAPG
jgi:hypothetical protein